MLGTTAAWSRKPGSREGRLVLLVEILILVRLLGSAGRYNARKKRHRPRRSRRIDDKSAPQEFKLQDRQTQGKETVNCHFKQTPAGVRKNPAKRDLDIRLFAAGANVNQGEGRSLAGIRRFNCDHVLIVLSPDFQLDDRTSVVVLTFQIL